VLTDHGPKLLPLTISCKQHGASDFFDKEVYRTSVGYAYAGATLPALSTHALANTVFQNLGGAPGVPIPGLQEIALATADVAVRYMRDVSQLAGSNGLFSAIIFGFCSQTNRYMAFEIMPTVESGFVQAVVSNEDLQSEDALVIIGTNPERLREKVNSMKGPDMHPVVRANLPRQALAALIDEEADGLVGGAIQYGWVTPQGFELVAHMAPIDPPLPNGRNAALTELGFDMQDFRQVGYYQVIMTGRI
jgi:hypothetical protein